MLPSERASSRCGDWVPNLVPRLQVHLADRSQDRSRFGGPCASTNPPVAVNGPSRTASPPESSLVLNHITHVENKGPTRRDEQRLCKPDFSDQFRGDSEGKYDHAQDLKDTADTISPHHGLSRLTGVFVGRTGFLRIGYLT
jgi:hypothetical protein